MKMETNIFSGQTKIVFFTGGKRNCTIYVRYISQRIMHATTYCSLSLLIQGYRPSANERQVNYLSFAM